VSAANPEKDTKRALQRLNKKQCLESLLWLHGGTLGIGDDTAVMMMQEWKKSSQQQGKVTPFLRDASAPIYIYKWPNGLRPFVERDLLRKAISNNVIFYIR
jgi:hypothetical protein